jgi:PAS domain S-box-containing protein
MRPLDFEVVGTLSDCITILQTSDFDLVLLDLGLPDSDGIDTFKQLHTQFPHIPVIVITAHENQAIASECMLYGAQDYLIKGKVENFLNGAIHNSIERARLQRELELANAELKTLAEERQNSLDETNALLHATRLVLSEPDFHTTMRNIFDLCRNFIGVSAGSISILSEDKKYNNILYLESGEFRCDTKIDFSLPIRGLREEVYLTGKAIYINDFANTPYRSLLPEGHIELKSVMFAPMKIGGKSKGLLGFANKPGGFSERDARMAEAFGELAALALMDFRREEALQHSESKFRDVFHNVTDGILLFDINTNKPTMVNQAFCKMLGYSESELMRLQLTDMYVETDQAKFADMFYKPITGEQAFALDIALRRKDQTTCYVDINTTAIEIEGHKLLMGCFRDITEKKKIQAELTRAEKLASIGLLASGVAHEINNPLTYILFNMESLGEDLPQLTNVIQRCQHRANNIPLEHNPFAGLTSTELKLFHQPFLEDISERIDEAIQGIHRIKTIVQELSAFSRLDTPNIASVDVFVAIECAINMAHNEIKYRANLIKDYGPVPPVKASPDQLIQVFLNILMHIINSLDESNAASNKIRIHIQQEQNYVNVKFEDTGRGLTPEEIEYIFEPFSNTKNIGVGSGLSLSLCKNTLLSFGGDIEVHSEIGRGTCFSIKLPIATENELKEEPQQCPNDCKCSHRRRILLIDDESGVRTTIKKYLHKDHEVITAESGAKAQAIIEEDHNFDLLLCDLMMPQMSGMDLHQWLTKKYPELAKRTIFISGGVFTPKAKQYLNNINNPLLEKPFDMKDLQKLIANIGNPEP